MDNNYRLIVTDESNQEYAEFVTSQKNVNLILDYSDRVINDQYGKVYYMELIKNAVRCGINNFFELLLIMAVGMALSFGFVVGLRAMNLLN